jgi:hypothetical protein
MLGVLGHGYSLHDDFASGSHAEKLKSDGTNAAKAVSAPSFVRSLDGFRITRVVATQYASYLIAAGLQLVFRMGRDTPHGNASTASSEDLSDAEVLDSLQPITMNALTCLPVEHFAANGLSVACLIRAIFFFSLFDASLSFFSHVSIVLQPRALLNVSPDKCRCALNLHRPRG